MEEWPWKNSIALADMNAYFASVEQKDDPKIRNKPVVVTNGLVGHTIVASSYEAKRYGIHTGMSLLIAKQMCSDLIHRPSRPDRYSEVTSRIMENLSFHVTPDIEVFSIDEAFLDINGVAHRYKDANNCAKHIQQVVWDSVALPVSVGLSSNKTMSKFAAKQKKPRGVTVIPPSSTADAIRHVPVDQLCGIGDGVKKFLAKYGVLYCGQIKRIPVGILRQRFGYLGQKIWLMCQGIDYSAVVSQPKEEKTMGHSKVIPLHLDDPATILSIALHLTHRLTERMRFKGMYSKKFVFTVKTLFASTAIDIQFQYATQDTDRLFPHFRDLILNARKIRKIGILATNLQGCRQLSLFDEGESCISGKHHTVMDDINKRFGRHSLKEARLLLTDPVRVISPQWGLHSNKTPQ